MKCYTAVWDDEVRTPFNGRVVLTKNRFACDCRATDGSVVCYSTDSEDGEYYVGKVLEPEQRAAGTFTSPVDHTECGVRFRRHRATKDGIRMEYLRWWSDTEVMEAEELCDILLIPVKTPKRTKTRQVKKPAKQRARKR
jgi:hypothetical protein